MKRGAIKQTLALALIVLLFTSMLTGCTKPANNVTPGGANGNDEASGGQREAKDSITLLVQSEPATLDPTYANNDNITIVLQFIYEDLFTLGSDGNVYPELAEEYEIVDDTTVRFKLREGVKFSDGTDLKSSDVLWHIGRLQESPVSQSHFKFVNLENSYIEDDLNFVLKFNQAWAPFSNTMSTGRGSIPSQAAFEKVGAEEFARNPVGTGPYKLVKWTSGTQIELTRNENYWGEPAKTENVVIKFIAEPAARVIELETGAADISYYIEGTDIERVNNIDGYHIVSGDSFRYFTVVLSMQEELFKDERVRYAMSHAINKEALVKTASLGIGTPISGFAPPAMNGYMEMDEIPYDVEKAKGLMAEAGYPNGFSIELHVEPNTLFEKIAEVLQAMWSEIGIDTKIVSSALATYDAQNKGKFQASVRDGTATEISNVLIIYESTFGSRMNGNDKWLDEKLLELRTYYYGDPKREACLKEIMDHIHKIRFTYPFMVMPTVYAVSDKLEGFEFHPSEDHINPKNWVVYK